MKEEDHRAKHSTYDLNRIDYDWIQTTTKKKELFAAYEALKEDGGFPDLQKALEDKIKTVDPSFKRKMEGDRVSMEEQVQINKDMFTFLDEIN